MTAYYDKRSISASHKFTNCVVEGALVTAYPCPVLGKDEFLAEIRKRANSDADIGRALKLPSSRIAELFKGSRNLKYEEAKILADLYMPETTGSTVSAERLAPILSACLRYAPKGGWSEQDAEALARAVEYGLGLIANAPASHASADALAVAGQAALTQLRGERLPT